MFFNSISMYSISFIGIILIVIGLSFSNTRSMFTYQLHTKRKKRHSINDNINDPQKSCMVIQMKPLLNLNASVTRISLEDDEELMKSDVSSISALSFCENTSIELRLEHDLGYDDSYIE